MTECMTCGKEALHCLEYTNIENFVNWVGRYCPSCFVKKLRGMAQVHKKILDEAVPS